MKCSLELQQKYLAVDNLLILHLTDSCNNRCKFCMVDEIHGSFVFPYQVALTLIDQLPAQAKVDLFGGEPTLYPQFFELLRYLQAKDLQCSIATNGRLFADQDFTNRVVALTGQKLYVRTSLYGLTDEVHDRITRVKNSYAELMQGLDHIVAAGLPCQVNIVITKLNVAELPAITQLVIEKGVPRIKFGLLVDAQQCMELVPTLAEIRPQLLSALQLAKANGLTVTIEKAPLCLVPEYLQEFSSERELGQWPRCFADTAACAACLVRKWCDGLDPGYFKIFGPEGLRAINSISPANLTAFPSDLAEAQVRFLKFNLFSLPTTAIEQQQCEAIILGILEQAKQKLARVAFVPAHLHNLE